MSLESFGFLTESGDALLAESGDALLLESPADEAPPAPAPALVVLSVAGVPVLTWVNVPSDVSPTP